MKIICENSKGEKSTFGWFPPLWLASVDGLGTDYNVYTSKNSGQDGENYNGSDAKMRNILIALDVDKADFLAQRNRLYSFFQPRSSGVLYYYEGDEAKKIAYYVEKVEPGGTDNDPTRTLTISLICPDPKFYALEDQLTQLAVWQGKITFPLRFPPQINASGQSVTLSVDDSIKDYDKIAITGASVETGSGDKSPDNPYALPGATALTVSDGAAPLTVPLPRPLYGLPDGTCDEYDAVGGQGTRRVGRLALDGTEPFLRFRSDGNNATTVSFDTQGSGGLVDGAHNSSNLCCSHFKTGGSSMDGAENVGTGSIGEIYFEILRSRLAGWDDDWTNGQKAAAFKAWLAAQAAAGTPVAVLYKLAAPVPITGAVSVPIYHPTTILSLDAGTLSLRCRGRFVVTEKVNTLIGNVRNDSAVPMGLTVTFRASGTVVNPSLYDVNRQLLMQVNTTMHAGDQIVITTGDGNKRVKLISGGVTTNINNLMAYPPHWLQAQQGDNLYRYNADEGIDNLSVSIVSTEAFWGA